VHKGLGGREEGGRKEERKERWKEGRKDGRKEGRKVSVNLLTERPWVGHSTSCASVLSLVKWGQNNAHITGLDCILCRRPSENMAAKSNSIVLTFDN
jgi:hypothetical protein